jgi:ubiquitin-like-conjugating enzyme ATG10
VELDEEDDEVVASAVPCPAVVHYDILLSPSYRVPVLYCTVVDSQHRYPPTPETLHSCVIPPKFRMQTEHVGVIGGITTTVRICRS